jgi:hypothetical protein
MIFDLDLCRIDIQIGNTVVQRFELPIFIAQAQFIQLVAQIKQDSRPMRVTCFRDEQIEEGKTITNSLSFENKAYIESYDKRQAV